MFNIIHKIKEMLIEFNQSIRKGLIFRLRLEDIKYNGINYSLKFRMQLKSTMITYTLQEALNDKLYKDLNPFDSYCIGIMHALSTTSENYCLDRFACKLGQYNHFDMDKNFELIECDYYSGTIVLKLKHSNLFKRILIFDFIESAYILYSLNAENAYRIGYFVTEYLIEH